MPFLGKVKSSIKKATKARTFVGRAGAAARNANSAANKAARLRQSESKNGENSPEDEYSIDVFHEDGGKKELKLDRSDNDSLGEALEQAGKMHNIDPTAWEANGKEQTKWKVSRAYGLGPYT